MSSSVETTATEPQVHTQSDVLATVKKFLTENSGKNVWASTDQRQLVVPVKVKKNVTAKSGPINPDYLHENKIHIVHYDEPSEKNHRRVVIAYKYEKDEKSSLRHVQYGACVFKQEKDSKETFDKRAHNWTAINRLMNFPVKVELHFDSISQFNKDLRKCLFKRGVQASRKSQSSQPTKSFVLNLDTVQAMITSN